MSKSKKLFKSPNYLIFLFVIPDFYIKSFLDDTKC